MEPPVAAAVISSSVALFVAVLGVLATGLAGTRATTRAHANALALFDKQADERLRLAHLEHKRDLYARLLNLMDEYRTASRRLVEATKAVSNVSVDAQRELRHELE